MTSSRRVRLVRAFARTLPILIFIGATHPSSAQRMVFAHYMLTNQDYQADDDPSQEKKIASYEREIRQAQSVGIDGFALNAGGWLRQTYYIRYSAQMFEAALRLHTGFRLMFSADMCCGNGVADVEDMMRRFAGNPRYSSVYFRYRGKPVLTTFAGEKLGPAAWRQIRTDLAMGTHPSAQAEPTVLSQASAAPANTPMKIFLVPAFFWGGELPDARSIQEGLETWSSIIDGSFYWGIAGVPGAGGPLDQTRSMDSYAATMHRAGKLFMAPICLQFWGANADRYYEYSGASGMRSMWMDAIHRSHPDWVEIITWNDFIEGTYVSPIDDPNRYPGANYLDASGIPLGTLSYFHTHQGATALLAFFIRWYKTGVKPAIRRDAVYFFYRTQPAGAEADKPPVSHTYGPVADRIYVSSNLIAPADLIVASGEKTITLHLPAGSIDTQTPSYPGPPPIFTLTRNGKTIASGSGVDPIDPDPRFNNYYDSSGVIAGP